MIPYSEFITFVRQNVFPELAEIEKRDKKKIFFLKKTPILLALSAGALFVEDMIVHKSDGLKIFFIILFLTGFIGSIWLSVYKKNLKEKFRPKIMKNLRLEAFQKKSRMPVISLRSKGLLPSYSSCFEDDCFCCTVLKTPFAMREVRLKKSSGSGKKRRSVTVFQGPIVYFDTEKNYPATVLVKEKRKTGLFLLGEDKKNHVTLEDPEFEEKYAVFSKDQIGARKILTPAFMETLKKVETVFQAPASLLFDKNQVIVAIDTRRDMFEFIDLKNGLTDEAPYRRFYEETAALQTLGELLKN